MGMRVESMGYRKHEMRWIHFMLSHLVGRKMRREVRPFHWCVTRVHFVERLDWVTCRRLAPLEFRLQLVRHAMSIWLM